MSQLGGWCEGCAVRLLSSMGSSCSSNSSPFGSAAHGWGLRGVVLYLCTLRAHGQRLQSLLMGRAKVWWWFLMQRLSATLRPQLPVSLLGASHGTVPTSCAGMLLQLHPGGSVRLVSGHQALTVPAWLFSMFLLTFADVTLALSLAALRGCMGCTVLCAAPAVCAVFILIDRIRSLMHCMKAVMQIYATRISRLCLAQDSNLLSSVWRTALQNPEGNPIQHPGADSVVAIISASGQQRECQEKMRSNRQNSPDSPSWVVCGEKRAEYMFTEANVLLRLQCLKYCLLIPSACESPYWKPQLLAVGFLSQAFKNLLYDCLFSPLKGLFFNI